ncbi:uncharacterized protein LOC129313662 isoform X1 [Prosopis cineraria]|uniref:uncharacterized protein LOC129313662 isoform X1 n=1 Tax=Prosopis cineraria TaxID=364024 RepID=UPI00240FBE54|nr:uncharacterized protein LOC129313662 isoform X1 [Prosopis cineraria]XP_054812927.1 uncharacterized protein LOC129313662 isoform X1 [Prosopis cineraria]
MLPEQWVPPCGNRCTHKYAALTKLPCNHHPLPILSISRRVFCKKGCNSDEETWEECLEDCNHICYKDPVIKDQQWSAYIDRSPGSASCSEECFHACASGCGFKFNIKEEEVEKACPNRPSNPPAQKPGQQHEQPTNQSAAKPGSSA